MFSQEALHDTGWTDPLDESPIETPDGWHHGAVVHTGGHIYCRTWHSRENPNETEGVADEEMRYEVAYGSNFDGVAIESYEYDVDADLWTFAGTETLAEVPEQTDEACAEQARELMAASTPAELADAASE